jgi:hypothetical protein
MSSQIKPVLVKDDLLLCDSSIDFAVQKGGQNVSFQRFTSNAVSSTSHSYTIQSPSTSVILDRELMWHTEMSITIKGVPNTGDYLVDYGKLDAFAPFPLHQNVINAQAQINNTTVSCATQQMLDALLRNMDKDELARYNGTTPVMLDNYGNYNDIQLNSYNTVVNVAQDATSKVITQSLKPVYPTNSPFNDFKTCVNASYPPRGSFKVKSISGNTVGDGSTTKFVVITVEITEPVMLSPFIFGDVAHKSQGIYGISQINLTFQMDATAKRCFRWIPTGTEYYTSKSIDSIAYSTTESYIECRFLTPHPSDLLPEVNILPYSSFVNFQTVENTTLAVGGSKTTVSSNIQLNSVPDKLILYVRNKQSLLTPIMADAYCAITGIRILWNNNSGLLSSATQHALYKMSVEAGSRQSWDEFRGSANVSKEPSLPSTNWVNVEVSTCSSVLTLDFARHIALSEDFYAPGSLGAFNLQIQVDYTNTTGMEITPEFNVLTMNSGVFATQNGQSSVYTGVLNKQQVLDASLQTPMGNSQLKRYVGGGFFDSIKAIASPLLSMAKPLLSAIPHPVAQTASNVLGALGLGKGGAITGGAETGAGISGGRKMRSRLM